MMAGILETGGAIDNLFDVVRGELGKADTSIQEWFHDKLGQSTDRYAVQKVLWEYAQGLKAGHYSQFKGYDDPDAGRITAELQTVTGLPSEFIYNVLFALYDTARTDPASASVLAGSDGNVFDAVMNGGVTRAVTGAVNDTLAGLGLPSLANTVIILAIVGVIVLIIYLKVKR